MNFIEMWQEAIENDPYWQFEELIEKDPELAEALWRNMRVEILVQKRLDLNTSITSLSGEIKS